MIVIGINQIPDRGKGEEMHKENFFFAKKKERWKNHQMKNRTETLFKKKHMKIFICKALFFFFLRMNKKKEILKYISGKQTVSYQELPRGRSFPLKMKTKAGF